MVRPLQILAVILAGVAVFFWWRENSDATFAAGVLAAASYFLSMRFEMKARINKAYAERKATADDESILKTDE